VKLERLHTACRQGGTCNEYCKLSITGLKREMTSISSLHVLMGLYARRAMWKYEIANTLCVCLARRERKHHQEYVLR